VKILNFGHLCIDHNISENSTYTAPGSPAVFMNKIFSQLPDIEFTTVASYGKDFLAYKDNFKLYPEKPNISKTLVYENKSEIGGETSQRVRNRDEALPVPIDDKIIELIHDADIIIISPLLPNFSVDYYKQIYDHAKKKTSILLLPQGYFRDFDKDDKVIAREFEEINEILPFVDAITVSFFDKLFMTRIVQNWVKKSDVIVIETLSDKGALIISKEGQFHIPTIPMPASEIVDSVGSGDVFSASFIYWYKRTRNLHKAVEFANELARQKLYFTSDKIKIDYNKVALTVQEL
jgi:sugar/nucleoside kinase (ribokinase family)